MDKFWSVIAFFINMFGWVKWKFRRTLYEARAKRSVRALMRGDVTLPSSRRHTRLPDGGMKVEYFEHGVLAPSKTEVWSEHEWREHCKVLGIPMTQSYN